MRNFLRGVAEFGIWLVILAWPLLALACLFWVMGCAMPPRASAWEVHISPDLDALAQMQTEDALAAWEQAAGVSLSYRWTNDACPGPNWDGSVPPCFDIRMAAQPTVQSDCKDPAVYAVGCEYGDGTNEHVVVSADMTNMNKRRRVILHEIGHALGLQHSTHQDAIMYPHVQDLPGGITQHDMDLFWHIDEVP